VEHQRYIRQLDIQIWVQSWLPASGDSPLVFRVGVRNGAKRFSPPATADVAVSRGEVEATAPCLAPRALPAHTSAVLICEVRPVGVILGSRVNFTLSSLGMAVLINILMFPTDTSLRWAIHRKATLFRLPTRWLYNGGTTLIEIGRRFLTPLVCAGCLLTGWEAAFARVKRSELFRTYPSKLPFILRVGNPYKQGASENVSLLSVYKAWSDSTVIESPWLPTR